MSCRRGHASQERGHGLARVEHIRAIDRGDGPGSCRPRPVEVVRHDHDRVGAAGRDEAVPVRIGVVDELVPLVPSRRPTRGRDGQVGARPDAFELGADLPNEGGVLRLQGVRHRLEVEVHPIGVARLHRVRDVGRQAPAVRAARQQRLHGSVIVIPGHHRHGQDDLHPARVRLRDHLRHRGGCPARPPDRGLAARRLGQRPVRVGADREVRDRGHEAVVEVLELGGVGRPVRQIAEDFAAKPVREPRDGALAVAVGARDTAARRGVHGRGRTAGLELEAVFSMLGEHLGMDGRRARVRGSIPGSRGGRGRVRSGCRRAGEGDGDGGQECGNRGATPGQHERQPMEVWSGAE